MNKNNNQNKNPRRDPLTEIVDIDSQRLGAELIHWLGTQGYPRDWPAEALPTRPLGVVKLEILRQFATFLVPTMLMVAVWFLSSNRLLFAGSILAAFGLFALLDRQLMTSIDRKLKQEKNKNQGSYETMRELAWRLNLAPSELTSKRVRKLFWSFMDVKYTTYIHYGLLSAHKQAELEGIYAKAGRSLKGKSVPASEKRMAVLVPVERSSKKVVRSGSASSYSTADDQPATHSTNYAPVANDDFDYDEQRRNQEDDDRRSHDYHYDDSANPWGGYNPANGLPLMGNSPIDVGGNTYGSSGFDHNNGF